MGAERDALLLRLTLFLVYAGDAGKVGGASWVGGEAGVDALVERHHRYLLALLEYKTGDPELARDLLQDTYVSFLRAVLAGGGGSRWSSDDKVRNYLITIALNKVRDHFRARSRRSAVAVAFRTAEEMEGWLENAASGEPSPEEALAEREERERCRRLARLAMEGLAERDRMVLALKFGRGMDNPGIAREMGIGIKAVESLVFRAKRRFRAEFEKLGGGPE